ncbi:MAG: hypothetical protein K2L14_08790 [Duncaniella sp.]|nr:hypothetical protein [Duncaniella sp.]
MKNIRLIIASALVYTMCSCGVKNASANDAGRVGIEDMTSDSGINQQEYSDLIKTVYAKFVFAIDADPEVYAHPERYFTANALAKLKDSYEFDCEDNDCYAFYELRTQNQDSKPGTSGESDIISIEHTGDDWYIVRYSDMGWAGMTLIRIVDGRIDDFNRDAGDL